MRRYGRMALSVVATSSHSWRDNDQDLSVGAFNQPAKAAARMWLAPIVDSESLIASCRAIWHT